VRRWAAEFVLDMLGGSCVLALGASGVLGLALSFALVPAFVAAATSVTLATAAIMIYVVSRAQNPHVTQLSRGRADGAP
jgi:hypothetical protein